MSGKERTRAREPKAGEITRIVHQQKNPERVSLYIDGEFAFGLPATEVVKRGLKKGQRLTEDDVATLAAVDEGARATDAAVQFIAHRPRSEREVRDRLRKRGYSTQAIEIAVEKVRGWNYLNDQSFAEFWVENRVRHRPRGARMLAQELRQKGVDRQIIDQVLEETELHEDEAAVELARKRLPRLSGLDPSTRQQRLSQYLARRGFDWETVRSAVRTVLGEIEGEDAAGA